MIRIWIPSFSNTDDNNNTFADSQIIDDGTDFEVIDGSSGLGTTKLIESLKCHNIRYPYLHISTVYYSHYCGIREIIKDNWFKPKGLYCPDPDNLLSVAINTHDECKRIEALNLKAIIKDAKRRGIPVTYLYDGLIIQHGDIKIVCYCNESEVNNGSLCYWFPEIKYCISSDVNENIYRICKNNNINPVFFRIPYNNYFDFEQAKMMKDIGALYCWDNNHSSICNKLNCEKAGLIYIDCSDDIDCAFANEKGIITQDDKNWIYEISYKGLFEEEWVENSNGWWYRYKDGTWAIGWTKLKCRGKDAWFYFDERGYTVTGWQLLKWDKGEDWFYFDLLTGAMKTGWVKTFGIWYYLNPVTGAMHTGWLDYEGKKCYFEPQKGYRRGQAYRNRIALIDDELWEFNEKCYGKPIADSFNWG